jgi:hypothetical protein
MIGARSFAETLLKLEVAGRNQQLDGCDRLLLELDQSYPLVIAYLEDYLDKNS